jgi:hypothetical protein
MTSPSPREELARETVSRIIQRRRDDLIAAKASTNDNDLRAAVFNVGMEIAGGIANAWQPFETAPMNEQKILATAIGYEWPEVIFYQIFDEDTAKEVGEPGFWRYADDLFADVADIEYGQFTHWRPLPAPPSIEE